MYFFVLNVLALICVVVHGRVPQRRRQLDKIVIYNIDEYSTQSKLIQSVCDSELVGVEVEIYSNKSPNSKCSNVNVKWSAMAADETILFEYVMERSGGQVVMFMSSACRPTRKDWPSAVDDLIVEPNAKFWVKASLSPQHERSATTEDSFYHHLTTAGIYHFTPDFRAFYQQDLKPFILGQHNADPFSVHFHRYLHDWGNMERARYILSKFVVDDFISTLKDRTLHRSPDEIFQCP